VVKYLQFPFQTMLIVMKHMAICEHYFVSLVCICYRKECEVQQPPLYHLATKHAGGESKYENASTEIPRVIRVVKNIVFCDVM
jgi:hypothetical protein